MMASILGIQTKAAKEYAPVAVVDATGANSASSENTPALVAVEGGGASSSFSLKTSTPSAPVQALGLGARAAMVIRKQMVSVLLAAVSISALLLFWHLATLYKWNFYIRFTNVPSPEAVFTNFVSMAGDHRFQTNIGMSVKRILEGFAIATLLGVMLGLVCGRFKILRGLLFPALEVLRPIPAIAWVPISIMLWPTTETSIVFITFIGAFFPIFMNTMAGVKGVDPVLLRAAQALGASEFTVLTKVVLPAALPSVFTGLAVGMGVAWVSLIAAEMISGQFGVGYFTWEAYSLIEYPNIVLGMVVIGVLGLLCSGAIVWVSRLLMPWVSLAGKGSER
ncbi:ABC transporter permease [Limnobacter humi]|uniref:ABC transporter permease n=1 Tax=Limnobacter humi TaxID=1778671 RepID=A0ABT1WHT3_9BURK|nr:ABC transporter permease [Limnobacter humi]MCQ8896423.1 ABC transporter permease [Limnobacter humi]